MGKRGFIEILIVTGVLCLVLFLDPGILLPDQTGRDIAALESHLEEMRNRLEQQASDRDPLPTTANVVTYQSGTKEPTQWANNLVFPSENLMQLLLKQEDQFKLFETPQGKFMAWRWEGSAGQIHYGFVQVLAPYLSPRGETVWGLPSGLSGHLDAQYSIVRSGQPLKGPDGKVFTQIQRTSPVSFGWLWYVLFFLYTIILFTLCSEAKKKRFFKGAKGAKLDFLIDIIGLSILYFIFSGPLESLLTYAPFHPEPESAVFISRLWTGSILLTAISLNFPPYWKSLYLVKDRLIGATLAYLALTGGMFGLLVLVEQTVSSSGIDFYFQDVFHIQPAAWIAIGAIILLMFSLFLWSSRWMAGIMTTGLLVYQRLLCFGLAFGIIAILYWVVGSSTGLFPFFLSSLAIALLLDQFVETRKRDLTWLIVWLMVFTGFTANLIFALQLKAPTGIATEIVEQLEETPDPVLLHHLESAPPEKEADATQRVSWRIFWNEQPYLTAYYDYSFSQDSLTSPADQRVIILDPHQYSFRLSSNLVVRISLRQEPEQAWKFEPLRRPAYRGLTNLDRFHYALYDQAGIRVKASTDTPFPAQVDLAQENSPPLLTGEGNHIYYKVRTGQIRSGFYRFTLADGRWVDLKYRDQNLIKPISLFSFLFSVLFLIMPLFALLNRWFDFFPPELRFTWSAQSSLGNRIQIYVLALIVLSFVAIGAVTVVYFQRTETAQLMMQNRERLDALRAELESELDQQTVHPALLNRLARSHRQEIRFFKPDGRIQAQSEGLGTRLGLAPQWAHYQALSSIQNGKRDYILQRESIGQEPYDVVYRALSDANGGLVGIFGFPLRQASADTGSLVTGFFGMLLNVYVFLLFIAGAVAIAVASSITQPLTRLRNSLTQVKLGRNEPIPYEGRDELGVLIWEYNQMLKKLEESTRQLAQSERESAWREMAKRVAHEIKNPLTPMKLSIQHLQYVMKSDPEAGQALMERTSHTLIEQIETLSRIASAFSDFAKMPNAKKVELDVGPLLRSVHALFEQQTTSIQFELDIPDAPLLVEADRNQLLRVFNNLYKNAEQSISEDRPGIIRGRIELPDAENLLISVCDNGMGIPEKVQEKVFIPEFTTKSSGSGLGLAMSKDIISAFGGDIYFETKPGEGTCFFIRLPRISSGNTET